MVEQVVVEQVVVEQVVVEQVVVERRGAAVTPARGPVPVGVARDV
ncbi:hypothetical protein ACIP6I_34840 [Streptomyces anulatus]